MSHSQPSAKEEGWAEAARAAAVRVAVAVKVAAVRVAVRVVVAVRAVDLVDAVTVEG